MKRFLIPVFTALLAAGPLVAAAQQQPSEASYRRSSLCLMLIDEPNMPKRDTIKTAFLATPVPDKYNDHNVGQRVIPYYSITENDRVAYRQAVALGQETPAGNSGTGVKKKGSAFGSLAKGLAGAALSSTAETSQSTVIDVSDKEVPAVIANKFLLEQAVAKQLFDKWFIEDGRFNMNLIKERGLYDATVMDVQTAKNSVRGMGLLEDAGEELISNTFVVVSRYRYMSKDELVDEMTAAAQLASQAVGGSVGEYASLAASVGSVGSKMALGAGYYVRTISYLFQLQWNDEIANTLYAELWNNIDKYNASDIFTIKYIGEETAFANVKAGIFTNKPEEELIRIATINATDAVLAKLETKYDVFKTKTPLLSVSPYATAAIGMKEGVAPGDKYEVLERNVDPQTNRTTYKRVAVLKAASGQIWDNRYMAAEELTATGGDQSLTTTRFEGSLNGLYPGMLLRQTK
ncbi:MAG: hypothetical protein LBU80_05635 [Rikenellaceae bacterium]|jgi:hypothetical protein|nr:hypothetical protein [Rikenellaceae bacterium]